MGTYGPQLKEAKVMTEILYRTSVLSALLCYRQNDLYHLQKSKEHIKGKVERELPQNRDKRQSWKGGKRQNSQRTVMTIHNYFTFWCLIRINVLVANSYNLICTFSTRSSCIPLKVRFWVGLGMDLNA